MEPSLRVDLVPEAEARRLLRAACGSSRWVEQMMSLRPFGTREALLRVAEREWFALEESDWREAFAHHPKIGDRQSLAKRFPETHNLSALEQSGVANASEDVLGALAEGNRLYEEKFGFIFIVCATGKTAAEMLALLRERLSNDPNQEIRIAAGEQAKITAIRLATRT
jgi:2-oxo-4-hydroxy-4-carboxy-5-ureidoimidazoline decarboxylase